MDGAICPTVLFTRTDYLFFCASFIPQAEVTSGNHGIVGPVCFHQLQLEFDNEHGVWHLVSPVTGTVSERSVSKPGPAGRHQSRAGKPQACEQRLLENRRPSGGTDDAPGTVASSTEPPASINSTVSGIVSFDSNAGASSGKARDKEGGEADCGAQNLGGNQEQDRKQAPVKKAVVTCSVEKKSFVVKEGCTPGKNNVVAAAAATCASGSSPANEVNEQVL